jgi:hypothetical protein
MLMSLQNEIALLASENWKTSGAFRLADENLQAAKAEGIYEGLQMAVQIISERRRGLGGERDDRGHRESTQQTGSDPKTSARD